MKLSRDVCDAKYIVIYGYSKLGKAIAETIREINKDAEIVFLDKNKSAIETKELIYTIEEFDWEHSKTQLFIVASCQFGERMEQELYKRGISEQRIIIPEEVLKYRVKQYKQIIKKRMPREDFRFIVCITEHCNLNCASCDHFSPLSKPWFMDLEVFEKDLTRIAELFGDKVALVDIEGGEPLLHKDVTKFIRSARKHFPTTTLKLLTNGLLFSQMSDEFWEACKECNIIIKVTKYPIDVDYKKMKELVLGKGITFEYANSESEDKTMIHQSLDLEGKQDKYESFHACYMGNGQCAELREGRLYQCNVVANLHIFNEYFGKNLEVGSKDYIDIYSDVSVDEIMEYLCNPIPACRYCKTKEWEWGNKWQVSKKQIEEWV